MSTKDSAAFKVPKHLRRPTQTWVKSVLSDYELEEHHFKLLVSAAESWERLKDPAELMLLLIERTRQLGDTAAATRVFDELFGGTGAERLVTLIGQSTDEIRATIDEAHRLGNVLDDDVIKSAAAVDAEFNKIVHTVGQNLRGAIVSAASALGQFMDSFRAFENQQDASLDAEIATIGRQRMDLENKILKLRAEQRDAIAGNPFGRDYESDIAYLEAERAALGETEAQILRVVAARRKAAEARIVPGSDWKPAPYTPPPADNSGRDKAAAAAERERAAVDALIASLEHELSLIGLSELEQAKLNARRQAGAGLTGEQATQIDGLVEAIHREAEAHKQAEQAATARKDALTNLFGMAGDGLLSIVDGSEKAEDAVKRLAVQLALAAAQAALLGNGPLAGLFGMGGGISPLASSFISGGGVGLFSDGGYTGPGGKYQPAGIVHRGEYVVPKNIVDKVGPANIQRLFAGYANGGLVGAPKLPSLASSAASSGPQNVNINIDVTGAKGNTEIEAMVQSGVRAGLREYDRGSDARFVTGLQNARKRNLIR